MGPKFAPRTEHIYKHWGKRGGGYSDNILYKGVFGAGTAQKWGSWVLAQRKKMGVLVADTTRKKGGASSARCGYKPEGICKKRGSHRN